MTALWWSVVLAAGALLAIDVVLLVRYAAVSGARSRDIDAPDPAERSALAASRFTIPVSLITCLDGESLAAIDTVRSLLALEYPQYEVIAVADGTRSGVLDAFKREFELAPRQMFYRRSLPGRDVRAIYGSRDERLLVVDHASEQRSDGWNCGVNLARYRYVGIVSSDRVVARDALLTAMVPANADPAGVVAILGHLGAPPAAAASRADHGRTVASAWLEGFAELERARNETSGRAVPADLAATAERPEAFGLWRRDAVLEAGGFAPAKAGEGLDLAMRVRKVLRRPCCMVRMPDTGDRSSPETVRSFISAQARCYHAMLESAWRSRARLATFGGLRAFVAVASHVVPGLLEAWLLVALLLSVVFGVLGWLPALMVAATVSLAKGVVTNTALLFHSHGGTERPNPVKPMCLGALEFAVHRPLAAAAAVMGSYEFLRGGGGPERNIG